jgi:hypothetical protein
VGGREDLRAESRLSMERAKTTSDPRLKRELATRAFKLARAAEALGGEAEVKAPWYLSHGDARGDSIMQVFETKEAATDAACALVGKGARSRRGMEAPDLTEQKFAVFSMNGLELPND